MSKIQKPLRITVERDLQLVQQIKAQVKELGLTPPVDNPVKEMLFWEQYGLFSYPDNPELKSINPFTKDQRDRQKIWQLLVINEINLEYLMQLISKKQSGLSAKERDTAIKIFRSLYLDIIKKG